MKLRGIFLPGYFVFNSQIHGQLTLQQFAGKGTLRGGGVTHSGGFTYDMWKTAIASLPQKFRPQNCLVLGIGAGTIISMMQKSFPRISITAVDIDPIMIKIAKEYFSVSTEMIEADAIIWAEKSDKKFDIVIVDLYIGRYNPKKARTYDFLKNSKRLLKKGGQLLYNSQYNEKDPEEFKTFATRCRKVFSSYCVLREYPFSKLLLLS